MNWVKLIQEQGNQVVNAPRLTHSCWSNYSASIKKRKNAQTAMRTRMMTMRMTAAMKRVMIWMIWRLMMNQMKMKTL